MKNWTEKKKTIKLWGRTFTQKHWYYVWFSDTGSPTTYSGAEATCSSKSDTFTADTFKRTLKKKTDKIFDKCLSSVSETCEGRTVEMSEEGWQDFVSELVESLTFLIKAIILTTASEMSKGMVRGLNAARCALVSGGDNFWQLLASIYYLALELEYEGELVKLIDESYPTLCTCIEEIENIQEWFGAKRLARIIMKGCSEQVQAFAAKNAEVEDGGIPQDSVDEEEQAGETD